MRVSVLFLLALPAVLAAAEARAAVLFIPETKPAANTAAYNAPRIEQPWVGETPVARVAEQPIGEVISRRRGLVDGSAELFRYRVEGAPSNKTMLDGVIDGGGIKLKLTW